MESCPGQDHKDKQHCVEAAVPKLIRFRQRFSKDRLTATDLGFLTQSLTLSGTTWQWWPVTAEWLTAGCSSRICSPTEGCWFSSGSRPRGRDLPVLMYWQCKGLSQADYGWQDLTRNIGKLQNHSSTVFKNLLYFFKLKLKNKSSKYALNRSLNRPGSDHQPWLHTAAFVGQAWLLFPSEKCLFLNKKVTKIFSFTFLKSYVWFGQQWLA